MTPRKPEGEKLRPGPKRRPPEERKTDQVYFRFTPLFGQQLDEASGGDRLGFVERAVTQAVKRALRSAAPPAQKRRSRS